MGTGTALRLDPTPPPPYKLPAADEEKVSNIVEVCNVTREEAQRVLDICHMDETMAIERFLSGNEVSTWSQVSKKKKPAPPRAAPARPSVYQRPSDRDRDRRHPHDAPPAPSYRRGPRHHSTQKARDGHPPTSKKRQPASDNQPPPSPASHPVAPDPVPQSAHLPSNSDIQPSPPPDLPDTALPPAAAVPAPSAWRKPKPALAADPPVSSPVHLHDTDTASSPAPTRDSPQKPTPAPVKRTFNYAAAAAAGTSHAKPAPVVTPQTESESVAASPATEDAASPDVADQKKRRARAGRKARARAEPEHVAIEAAQEPVLPAPNGLGEKSFEARTAVTSPEGRKEPVASPIRNAWGTRPTAPEQSDEKRLEDTATAVAVASAAVVGATEQGAGDALSLQFGSFGLTRLDGVNWSATDSLPSAKTPTIAATEPVAVASAPLVAPTPSSLPAETAVSVGISSTSVPPVSAPDAARPIQSAAEARSQPQASLPSTSVGATGSGMFPVLPLAPGGNFPPPNYGNPYMMPPLHAYSPALGSYDNAGDLGSSRGPSLAPPGSLPLYDPAALPGSGKYGAIPGLGDMSGLPAVPSAMGKDGLHGNADMDKNASLGTSALPAGMDPLGAPYMVPGVPGYPSMQYPHMYTFPSTAYGPPGMAPGPSPFPYPPAGQVSSQGARGSFGFEDGSAPVGGNARAGAGLGESMYTPGGYLSSSMAHSNQPKGPTDAPYKQVRGNSHPGNGLGGMGMASGIVHGMAYGDYPGNVPGASNGVATNGGGPGSWNNRQPNGARADGQNGPAVSNQSMPGATQNSALYAAAPTGAPGGYWTSQQGGYYP